MAKGWSATDWNKFFETPNPWDYDNNYEQTKYNQTLQLLPDEVIGSALELACAEGHFTELLAPRVNELTGADISSYALRRAKERCNKFANTRLIELDFLINKYPEATISSLQRSPIFL